MKRVGNTLVAFAILGALIVAAAVLLRPHHTPAAPNTKSTVDEPQPSRFSQRSESHSVERRNTTVEPINAGSLGSTAEAARKPTRPITNLPQISSLINQSLAQPSPDARAPAIYLTALCFRVSEFDPSRDAPGEQFASSLTLYELCRGVDVEKERARMRELKGGTGELYSNLLRFNRLSQTQEHTQATTTVLANPNLYPAHVAIWIQRMIVENSSLLDSQGGTAARVRAGEIILTKLVQDKTLLELRRLDACATLGYCGALRAELGQNGKIDEFSNSVTMAIERQDWRALYALLNARY